MNIGCAARENLTGGRAVNQLRDIRREHALAAPGCARNEVRVREASAVLRSAQVIERDFRRESHSSGTPTAAGRRNHSRKMTESR